MEVGCEKQTLRDLNFYLYRRALHPELFHIYQSRRVVLPAYDGEIWILGLSHMASIRRGNGATLTELTANDSELLPTRGLVERIRFRGQRDCQTAWEGGMRFLMTSQVETVSPNLYRQCYRDLLEQADKRGMLLVLDQWATGELAPFTYIDYQARSSELHVDAYHAFPDDLAILKTQSIFEVRGKLSSG